jgi:hypothetical protein
VACTALLLSGRNCARFDCGGQLIVEQLIDGAQLRLQRGKPSLSGFAPAARTTSHERATGH